VTNQSKGAGERSPQKFLAPSPFLPSSHAIRIRVRVTQGHYRDRRDRTAFAPAGTVLELPKEVALAMLRGGTAELAPEEPTAPETGLLAKLKKLRSIFMRPRGPSAKV
jgi:hypothetical protein